MSGEIRRYANYLLPIFLLCALGLALTLPTYDRVWFDHDDGLIGLMAQLTLSGMRSHVDFFDPYSGFLNLWHAAFFSLLGENMRTPRIAVVLSFTATIPLMYLLARQLVDRCWSFIATALWIVWSLPQYICSMPTWYNIFLNITAIALFIGYLNRRHPGFLFAAGIATGISISIKVIGLYLLAGALLFLVFDSQSSFLASTRKRVSLMAVLLMVTGTVISVVAAGVLRRHLNAEYLIFFVVPIALSWVPLIARERFIDEPFRARLHEIVVRRYLPYLAGIIAVVAAWLLRYPSLSELATVANGIFILPHRRAELVVFPLPAKPLDWSTWVCVALLITALVRRSLVPTVLQAAIIVISTLWLTRAGLEIVAREFDSPSAVLSFVVFNCYYLLVCLSPLILLATFVKLANLRPSDHAAAICFLLAAVTAYFQLVMYPFSAAIYFAYATSPLILIAATTFNGTALRERTLRWGLTGLWLFAGAGLFGLNHYKNFPMPGESLATERGLARFSSTQSAALKAVTAIVEQETGANRYIYAGPDAPEILFLTKTQHVGGIIIEALQGDADKEAAVVDRIMSDNTRVAVIKRGVPIMFTGELHKAIEPRLREIFDVERRFGHYSVLTRTDAATSTSTGSTR